MIFYTFQNVWKVSRQSGKFTDNLESFPTVWKVSEQSGKFPKSLGNFQRVWKVSGQSGNFSDSLESFRTVWKDSGVSRKVSDSVERSRHICHGIHGMYVKAIYALLAHLCRKSYLRTFGGFLSRKRFTRSVRKVFAREILPTGKFQLFVSLPQGGSFSHPPGQRPRKNHLQSK